MIEMDPVIRSELERMFPRPDGGRADWGDVLQRAGITRTRLRTRRPLLAIVLALVLLASAGVAIAAAVGAFGGISAANRPQTSADVLSAQFVAKLTQNCDATGLPASAYLPQCHLVLDSSRLVSQFTDRRKLYVIADSRGDLCVLMAEVAMSCGTSLTPEKPLTATSFGEAPGTPTILYGVALDGVTAVSFSIAGQDVSVPVTDNVWAYEGPPGSTIPEALTAHFNDGTTVTMHG